MAPPSSTYTAPAAPESAKKNPSFVKNVIKNKHKFIQCFAMTGIFLLSVRSLGQKYRMHNLTEDIEVLKEEKQSIHDRTSRIKESLFHEAAAADSTGLFAQRVRHLFAGHEE